MVSTIATDVYNVLTRAMIMAIIPENRTLRYCNVTTTIIHFSLTANIHRLPVTWTLPYTTEMV